MIRLALDDITLLRAVHFHEPLWCPRLLQLTTDFRDEQWVAFRPMTAKNSLRQVPIAELKNGARRDFCALVGDVKRREVRKQMVRFAVVRR